ncbi:MAG: ATP-binding protein, partial [Fusobacteriaceae bacterium]|nr:ATP-binding protein [Fusobacteriaceae bacterium]
MIFGQESETLEFKKTTAEAKDAVIDVVAMLNKHGRGELYFGIGNDGRVLGQTV